MGNKPSFHQKEASKATAKFRASNAMPKGTQVQHWTKVLSAKETGMSTTRMNQNLSPLQSRNALPATTLLTSKNGTKGTQYTVHEKVSRSGKLSAPKAKNGKFGNEHKFADRHLIPAESKRFKGSNANINNQDLAEVSGGSAKWKMTGDPGNVGKHLMETAPITKPGSLKALLSKFEASNAKAAPAKPAPSSGKSNKSSSTQKSANLRVSKAGSATSKPTSGPARITGASKAPSASPKSASGGSSNTSSHA